MPQPAVDRASSETSPARESLVTATIGALDPAGEPAPLSGTFETASTRGHTTSAGERCPHATRCGGCPLFDLPPEAQLAQKKRRVETALSMFPDLDAVLVDEPIAASPSLGYRSRAKLIVGVDGSIGLFARDRDHEVVDVPECKVLSPALAETVSALRALTREPPPELASLVTPFGGRAAADHQRGALRAVDLRELVSEGEESRVLLTFVLERDAAQPRELLREAARHARARLSRVVGVAVSLHDGDSPQVLGAETWPLDGVSTGPDQVGEAKVLASFGSFVQAHRGQAARIQAAVRAVVDEVARSLPAPGRARVLDLYGGSGSTALVLAREHEVVLVESFGPAAQNALLAAEAAGVKRHGPGAGLEVRPADVTDAVGFLARRGERFDVVVVNPPRRGVPPEARQAIARLGAARIVYVSCSPDTLARDLDSLARLGYAAERAAPLDMIPQTEEVETVVVLRRERAPRARFLLDLDGLVALERPALEPIASLLERAGLDGALVLGALDPDASGVTLVARDAAAAARWRAPISQARGVYVAAVRGVTPGKGAISREHREGAQVSSARTRYRRLSIAAGHSVLRVLPDVGGAQQLRRHLAAIGHPVLGDERFGHAPTNRYFEEKFGLDRPFVHLVRVELPRPGADDGPSEPLIVECPVAPDLRLVLSRAAEGVLRSLEEKRALGSSAA